MPSYAYTTVTGRIGTLLDKIHDVGIPPAATTKWLPQIGFTSSNDRSLLGVLRQIGFLDDVGKPTTRWENYKRSNVADRKKVLAQAVRDGYADLFSCYPNAEARSDAEIDSYFRSQVTAGSEVLKKTVQTFKALTGLSDFAQTPDVIEGAKPVTTTDSGHASKSSTKTITSNLPSAVNLTINIQLAVPETTDAAVYEAFFTALKKHVLTQ